ncbi:hypothetical protein [Nocardioides sp. HB32]
MLLDRSTPFRTVQGREDIPVLHFPSGVPHAQPLPRVTVPGVEVDETSRQTVREGVAAARAADALTEKKKAAYRAILNGGSVGKLVPAVKVRVDRQRTGAFCAHQAELEAS